jgi:Family of unknown function (DUF6455)
MAPIASTQERSIIARLGAWWRHRRERRAALADLAHGGVAERGRLAHDVGLASGELQVLAGKWPDSAGPLAPRMAPLGFDAAAGGRGEPTVMRDLQRVCPVCGSKRVCEHHLARGAEAAAVPDYCLNAGTFDAVHAQRTGESGNKAN